MEKIKIYTKKTTDWCHEQYDYIKVEVKYAKINGIETHIPDIGALMFDGKTVRKLTADDLNHMQIEHHFSHGGINPPCGSNSIAVVIAGSIFNSVDIGHNISAGKNCKITNTHLIIG